MPTSVGHDKKIIPRNILHPAREGVKNRKFAYCIRFFVRLIYKLIGANFIMEDFSVRKISLIAALFGLAVLLGCGGRNYYYDDRAVSYAPPPAPRTNLYPLTSPPPGTAQPVQGYAPTRISATQDYYGGTQSVSGGYASGGSGSYRTVPASYNSGSYNRGSYYNGGSVGSAYGGGSASYGGGSYGGGTYGDPFAGVSGTAFRNSSGAVCRVEDVTRYSNPNVPIGDPPFVENRINIDNSGANAGYYASGISGGYASGGATGGYTTGGYLGNTGYTTQTATYAPTTYAPSSYAGGGSTYTTANYASGPMLSSVASYGGATGATTTTSYGIGTYGAGTSYGAGSYGTTTYGTGFDSGVIDTSVYGGTSVIGGEAVQSGTTYGQVEGTADLARPIGAIGATYAGGAYPTVNSVVPAQRGGKVGEMPASLQPTSNSTVRPAIGGRGPAAGAQGQGLPVGAAGPMDPKAIRLVPATDIPPGFHPGDATPSQWFEVVRPGNAAIRIGRISATCTCVGVRIPKRFYEAGERVLLEARTVTKPPRNDLTYGIYVNVVEPVQTVVDADVTIHY